MRLYILLAAICWLPAASFTPIQTWPYAVSSLSRAVSSNSQLQMIDPLLAIDTAQQLSSSLVLSETQAWVQPTVCVLDPLLNFVSFAMLARVVLSWYPTTDETKMPWIVFVLPTEPLLRIVRGVIPPAFGVDITPIFWLGVFTFLHEILLGQQGLLIMKLKYGI
jgi:YggT family protein